MKITVVIDYTDGTSEFISHADKVELLGIGRGVLSVLKGKTNYCYMLQMIQSYKITNEEGAQE